MPNHSILTLNILHGLRGASDNEVIYEEAERIYFRFLDLKESQLLAEAKALDWIVISSFMHKVYPLCRRWYKNVEEGFTEEVQQSLHEFIRKRFEVYSRSKYYTPNFL